MHSILIVDDETDIREMLKQLFTLESYMVYTAANGREALDQIDRIGKRTEENDNVVLAYMAPVLYYVTSMGAGYKHMKGFWLMSLLKPGEAVTAEDKIYLLAAGLCMMATALVFRWKRRM